MRHHEQPLPPSQFGFASQPQFHREAKAAMLNREQRELSRINGGIVPSSTSQADPIHVSKGSSIYAGPEARLENISAAAALKRSQSQKAHQKQERLEKLKEERLDRDARRIQAMADELVQWDEDSKRLAGTGLKNRSSVGFNIVDGKWRDSSAAARAKFHDDMVKYYAKCRTQMLDDKSNGAGYNILTGEDRKLVDKAPIPRPVAPEEVRIALDQARNAQEQQRKLRDRPRYNLSPAGHAASMRREENNNTSNNNTTSGAQQQEEVVQSNNNNKSSNNSVANSSTRSSRQNSVVRSSASVTMLKK